MKIRASNTRGYIPRSHLDKDDYQSYRSFSCMSYQDPNYQGWGPIKTINDDRTRPGFITAWHEHKHLDIINYMIKGKCRHRDNIGNDNTANHNQVQHFWCGSSIWHELSNETDQDARYLQIWIEPNVVVSDLTPSYDIITREQGFNKLPIEFKNTKIEVYAGNLDQNCLTKNSYLLILEGECYVNDIKLNEGDAVDIYNEVLIQPQGSPHIILFELL